MATTGPPRQPGSFSPIISLQPTSSRPTLRAVESSSPDDSPALSATSQQQQQRTQVQNAPSPVRPSHGPVTFHANSSVTSLQSFSARPSAGALSRIDLPQRNVSPLPLSQKPSTGDLVRGHGRKHSQTQGSFEPYLPTAAHSNLGSMANLNSNLSASQIAAQAAMQHQNQHLRQRSQTVPSPQLDAANALGNRKVSRGPLSPPVLSLTEASAPKDSALGNQAYQNGLLGNHSAAQTAANVVFAKSPASSPGPPTSTEYDHRLQPDKPIKIEKAKNKLFSRPGKIGISKDKEAKSGGLPSPNKLGSYGLGALQKANMSTNSLADTVSTTGSMYSMANSSSATIRAVDTPPEKDKEKHKHHFLSRQKHKLSGKDDHHLPLSSAASNSKPVDPSAPSSLYNFNLPPSPGHASSSFAKSVSGLDLRHGGRALREKKKEEKAESSKDDLSYQNSNEWAGPSSLGSAGTPYLGGSSYAPSLYGVETQDLTKFGLNNMGPDDAWPYLRSKLLIIFEGEDLRLPVEDFNRLVSIHLQRCIQKRAPTIIVEDLRDLLHTGFSSLDQTLRHTPDDRLIPHLVEMWLFTFTSILPYVQAVFLPLDLEFSGNGTLMSADQAREFWGALPSISPEGSTRLASNIPASQALEVRRIVLIAYRDVIILPRFETLKTIFSRLSLESINLNPTGDFLSSSPDSFSGGRPGTAMSLDPSLASYGSQTTTLFGASSGDGSGSRSRAISNVSLGSSDPSVTGLGIGIPQRPFTPTTPHPFSSFHALNQRRAAAEDTSKQLTETIGRMLQCMSVLSSVGVGVGGDEGAQAKMEELCRGLKLNWLGRGRTGRNRRGLVGARVGKREEVSVT
ncbi:HbrB-like-domain-containing protein [Xylogone sp. PMI_703]|nr:HbrB-like-domain-containing protein [Xylogone sp. PMI_703]